MVYCGQCEMMRPSNAHHCYECDVCVLDLDHHCPWTGKCIGAGNQEKFYKCVSPPPALATFLHLHQQSLLTVI